MARTNKYQGTCPSCRGTVAAGAGLLEGQPGAWVTRHRPGDCQAPAAQAQPWASADARAARQREQQERKNRRPAELGLYRHNRRLYVIREFTPRPEYERDHGVRTGTIRQQGKVRYARELVENGPGNLDRAREDGTAIKLHSIPAPRMQWELRPEEALTLEEAKALNIKFGECVICGTPIEAKESVEDRAGIGPVCYARQSALQAAREMALA